jgi:Family of unknown function (DUF5675)
MIQIWRHEQTDAATLGALIVDGRMIGFALELPWRANRRNVSCIPPGLYKVRRREDWRRSRDHGPTFEVCNVPGRSGILFHPGNTVDDVEGCIAPGLSIGNVGDKRGVLHSGAAFKRFRAALDGVHWDFLHIQKIEGGTFHK